MEYSDPENFSATISPDYYSNNDTEPYSPSGSGSADYISLVMFLLTFLVGVPGNVMVIWVTGFKMPRTVNVVWFLNLASADLIYCLLLPFQVSYLLLKRWPFGLALCKALPCSIVLNLFASVFLLTAISVDRCLTVTLPVWSQTHRNVRRATVAGLAVWLLALALTWPSLAVRRTVEVLPGVTLCVSDYPRPSARAAVEASRFALGFVVPFVTILVSYSLIVHKIRSSPFHGSGSGSGPNPNPNPNPQAKDKAKAKARAKSISKPLKLISAVVVTFFLCWFPYHVVGLLLLRGHRNLAVWDNVSVGLASLNSAVNPLLYVFAGRDVQRRLRVSLATAIKAALVEDSLGPSSTRRPTKSSHSVSETRA